MLVVLGISILACQPITKCSLLETSFLVLVTASTINLLTTVLNDSPVLPEDTEEDALPILMDSPQCVFFGIFIIWFASITINLGPTFLSGTMAANSNFRPREPSCPLVQGPHRHYILNFLWISINLTCIILIIYHLLKLYRDFSETSEDDIRVATLVTSVLKPELETECMELNGHATMLAGGAGVEGLEGAPGKGGAEGLVGIELEKKEKKESLQTNKHQELRTIQDIQTRRQSLFHDHHEHRVLYADPVKVKSYLHKLEREGRERVKMYLTVTLAYLIFWGPLFLVTLVNWDWEFEEAKQSMSHEVTLHVAFVHSFVNPALFLVLHRGLREAAVEILCCAWTKSLRRICLQVFCSKCKPSKEKTIVLQSENRAFLKQSSVGSVGESESDQIV